MASNDNRTTDGTSATCNEKASEKSLSRRHYLTATGAASIAAFAGCTGSGGGDGGSGGTAGQSGNKAANKISVAAVGGEGELFQRLMDEYVVDKTGVQVDVSLFPYSNLFEKTSSVLTSKGDSFDLLFMDDPWFPQFAPHLEPVKDWINEDLPMDQLIQSTVDISTWPAPKGPVIPSAQGQKQQLKGLVIVGNTQLFAYNEKYFEQVGASEPGTWDDVYKTGKKVSEQIDGTHGYVIRGKRGNPINANFMSLGNSSGLNMFSKEWRYQWDKSKGVDMLNFYVNDLKSISPEGVASFDSDRILTSLGDGTVAQAPAWPAAASLLLDPKKADQANNIKFTPIPKGERRAPTQGNWIMGINKYVSDAKKRAVGKVMRSAISKEAQNKYVELGGVPFRHDTFKDNMDKQPWFPALYESLQTAKWRPRTPLWSRMTVVQGKNLNSALTGDVSPKKALANINDSVENTLKEAGYYE